MHKRAGSKCMLTDWKMCGTEWLLELSSFFFRVDFEEQIIYMSGLLEDN